MFQSYIKISIALKSFYTKDLPDLKQHNLLESGKFLCIKKSSRNIFILKPPFPQR